MKQHLGQLIAASLEDANVTMPNADVADVVAEVVAQTTEETSPIVEVMQNGAEVGDVVDVLDEIADVAELVPEADDTVSSVAAGTDGDAGVADAGAGAGEAGAVVEGSAVSTEALQASLAMVLRSHGQNISVTSLEAAGGDTREGVGRLARKTAESMRAGKQASFESAMGDVRGNLSEQAETVKKAGAVLAKIQSDLKSNGQLVQGKSLNYQGIYQFLNVDGEARFDIANVLKEEKAKLEGLSNMLKWFENAYKEISLDRESDPEKALDVLTRCISTLDYTNELVKFDGLKLLGNGTVSLNDEYGHPMLDLEYQIPKGDGSKATVGSRVLHSLIPGAVGGAVGGFLGRVAGALGGALVGGVRGAQAGADIGMYAGAAGGIAIGAKKGITKADNKVMGKETQVELTVDDVIEFVKAAQDLIGLVDKVKAQLIVADQGDTQIRNYLKTLHANMKKDDRWKVGAAKVAGFLATALVIGVAGQAGARYNGPVLGSGIKTHADEIIGNAADLVGAVYAANVSVADVLVTHVMNCVKGAIGVGAALLGEDPAKAMK